MSTLSISRAAVRRPFVRRRKSCPFSGPNAPKIDHKD
ncbi:MAG: 30S ribosomal protein S18, partial [Pseudomonadota bacterium]|nr:30S ribosomal protein S18 [Pseudomonadota bacterium]